MNGDRKTFVLAALADLKRRKGGGVSDDDEALKEKCRGDFQIGVENPRTTAAQAALDLLRIDRTRRPLREKDLDLER